MLLPRQQLDFIAAACTARIYDSSGQELDLVATTSSRRQKQRERTTSIPFPVASPGPETE